MIFTPGCVAPSAPGTRKEITLCSGLRDTASRMGENGLAIKAKRKPPLYRGVSQKSVFLILFGEKCLISGRKPEGFRFLHRWHLLPAFVQSEEAGCIWRFDRSGSEIRS